jgi:hypothetical protein
MLRIAQFIFITVAFLAVPAVAGAQGGQSGFISASLQWVNGVEAMHYLDGDTIKSKVIARVHSLGEETPDTDFRLQVTMINASYTVVAGGEVLALDVPTNQPDVFLIKECEHVVPIENTPFWYQTTGYLQFQDPVTGVWVDLDTEPALFSIMF